MINMEKVSEERVLQSSRSIARWYPCLNDASRRGTLDTLLILRSIINRHIMYDTKSHDTNLLVSSLLRGQEGDHLHRNGGEKLAMDNDRVPSVNTRHVWQNRGSRLLDGSGGVGRQYPVLVSSLARVVKDANLVLTYENGGG